MRLTSRFSLQVAMFFQLQTVRTTGPMEPGQDQYLARRQSQAVENIVFVLNAVGEKGRQNPCLFFPLYVSLFHCAPSPAVDLSLTRSLVSPLRRLSASGRLPAASEGPTPTLSLGGTRRVSCGVSTWT